MEGLKAAIEGRVMFPSTGSPEGDAEESQRIIRREAWIAEGLCPNGCAPLEDGSEFHADARCPKCGFVGSGRDFERAVVLNEGRA